MNNAPNLDHKSILRAGLVSAEARSGPDGGFDIAERLTIETNSRVVLLQLWVCVVRLAEAYAAVAFRNL